MNKLDFKNLVVKEIFCISGGDCITALKESKSFKRRYQLDSDVEYRVITNQGELHIFLKKGFEFDGRSGTPICDFVAPNLGSIKERFTWLTHDVNGYDLDLSFSDTNNLLWAMLVYLCGYSKFKASIIRYAVSLSKSWFGKPKKNDWCYKNVNKVSARWFPYDNI